MLKEAIEKIVSLAGPKVFQAEDTTFFVDEESGVHEIHKDKYAPDTVMLHSLDAVVKMVRTEGLKNLYEDNILYITVPFPTGVSVFTNPLCRGYDYQRPILYRAEAADVPGWDAEVRMPFDQAAVALQTRFQETPDWEYTMQLLSSITMGAHVTYNDIGVATNVVVQKGVTLQAQEKIRPLVKLRPYRTFQEVEQPEGLFLIRIDERGITFTEADGGMWKLHARQTVADWLSERLKNEVEAGRVVIAL